MKQEPLALAEPMVSSVGFRIAVQILDIMGIADFITLRGEGSFKRRFRNYSIGKEIQSQQKAYRSSVPEA